MCASEDEKGACETYTEAPPRIAMEHHESEKTTVQSKEKTGDHSLTSEEEEGEKTDLAARVLKLARGLSK